MLSCISIYTAAPEYALKKGPMYDKYGLPVETMARAALKLNTTREVIADLALAKIENYEHISHVAYPLNKTQYDKSKFILLMQLLERE